MLEEMKPLCGLSLEHYPQVGFGRRQGGGGWRRSQEQVLICRLCAVEAAEPGLFWASFLNVCVSVWVFGMTWHLPRVIIPQSLSRSSLWAASCLWLVTPAKRTRGETPPFSTAYAIPAHTGGLPECQGRVTMATNRPSTMESRSTGGTCSSYDVMLVYWFKWLERDS